ncbi:MAG: hypothetical protein KGL79_02360 [Acidobacteriota bacterium]|nr:hypothetical protein [Acidobacteriota bacterium]
MKQFQSAQAPLIATYGVATKRSSVRGRVLAVGAAAMSIVLATLTPSFLGNTASTNASVTPSSASSAVYPVAASGSVPSALSTLEYTTGISSSTLPSSPTLPSWTPAANSAGSVTTAGDVTVIDATGANNGVEANLYVTNMASLQNDYSSWVLPVDVYQCTPTTTYTTCSNTVSTPTGSLEPWTKYTAASGNFVTSTTGNLNFNFPKGSYYDIVVPTGGSYYCISTSNTSDLAPSFYVTAQAY